MAYDDVTLVFARVPEIEKPKGNGGRTKRQRARRRRIEGSPNHRSVSKNSRHAPILWADEEEKHGEEEKHPSHYSVPVH